MHTHIYFQLQNFIKETPKSGINWTQLDKTQQNSCCIASWQTAAILFNSACSLLTWLLNMNLSNTSAEKNLLLLFCTIIWVNIDYLHHLTNTYVYPCSSWSYRSLHCPSATLGKTLSDVTLGNTLLSWKMHKCPVHLTYYTGKIDSCRDLCKNFSLIHEHNKGQY